MTPTRRLLPAITLLLLPLLSASAGDDAEKKAIQAIKKLGGSIVRDEKVPGKPIIEVQIDVQSTDHWADEDLRPLAELKELQKLGIGFNEVTDVGLKHLTKLTKLRELGLESTRVTDAGLKELVKFQQLRALDLRSTK